jgi:mannose-6-phosphate isomerase-like protein (cupin superfamily)
MAHNYKGFAERERSDKEIILGGVMKKELRDYGKQPLVINIEDAVKGNDNYRTALWTGTFLQMTLMTIQPGEDVGLEVHDDTDQFFRVEKGKGRVVMGASGHELDFAQDVEDEDVILIPVGTWHNIINTGDKPLRLYSIYAPVHHPHGTVHETRELAIIDE